MVLSVMLRFMIERVRKQFLEYRYELIALLVGAIIMVLEIVGARVIAPRFGSSVYVWTAVIGVILGALSVGYWYGGKMADRKATDQGLSVILVLSALVLLVSLLTREISMAIALVPGVDVRIQALAASVLMFAPVNFLMGMVSPYVAKLKISHLATAGSSVGRLYAAGTVGSIVGTFAAGYWLIALMGSRTLGLSLILGLLVASFMASHKGMLWQRLVLAAAVIGLLFTPPFERATYADIRLVYDGDSAYTRWQVVETEKEGRVSRLLISDWMVAQSGIYVDKPEEPLFDYIRAFMRVAEANGPKKVLLIGGGTYTLPMMLTNKYPDSRIDVVEIDPKLDEVATRFFDYKASERIRLVHADGRTFLNENREQYDLILIDAFSSMVPPFQLTTREAVQRLAHSLAPDGVVAVNLIGARVGELSAFTNAEYATYLDRFKNVEVMMAGSAIAANVRQNLILIAGYEGQRVEKVKRALGSAVTSELVPGRVLTDDFAPVEQMTALH